MKLKYSTLTLNLYCKQTGLSLAQVADKIGIAYATVNRYARGERIPDISNLLRICNTLHLRLNDFFIHPDIEPTHVSIFQPEEWKDITFRYDRIEAIRLNRQLNKSEIIRHINSDSGCRMTQLTYNKMIVGEYLNTDAVISLLNATDTDIEFLFEQPVMEVDEDSIVISRKKLKEMKDYITRLENDCRELIVKNKRLEKKALPRYQERMESPNSKKVIRDFMRKIERDFAELQSWINEEEEPYTTAPSRPYPDIEDQTLMAAEKEG